MLHVFGEIFYTSTYDTSVQNTIVQTTAVLGMESLLMQNETRFQPSKVHTNANSNEDILNCSKINSSTCRIRASG